MKTIGRIPVTNAFQPAKSAKLELSARVLRSLFFEPFSKVRLKAVALEFVVYVAPLPVVRKKVVSSKRIVALSWARDSSETWRE